MKYFSSFRVVSFFLKIVVFAAFITALAHTYHFTGRDGVAKPLSYMFSGVSISDDRLTGDNSLPVVPPKPYVVSFLSQAYHSKVIPETVPDSMITIGIQEEVEGSFIQFAEDSLRIRTFGGGFVHLPYSVLTNDNGNLDLTAPAIKGFLKGNYIKFTLIFMFYHFFRLSWLFFFNGLIFAIVLLLIRRDMKFQEYFKITLFASTPILIGEVLTMVTDIIASWPSYIWMGASVFIILRAMYDMDKQKEKEKEESQ